MFKSLPTLHNPIFRLLALKSDLNFLHPVIFYNRGVVMKNGESIRVFFSSKTIGGGFKGRKGLEPVCHSCDKKLGVVHDSKVRVVIPSDVMPLVFSAELAAKELGIDLEVIDINQLSLVHRMNERLNGKPVPRVCIGEECITGSPSKDEIIALYHFSSSASDSHLRLTTKP